MRKFVIPILCCLLAVSCAKEGTKLYTGSYSFKTSGTITVTDEYADEDEGLILSLPNETGIMDIVEVDREKGTMIVTMNILNGDLLVFNAKAKNDRIELLPTKRHTTITYAGIDDDSIWYIDGIEDLNFEKKTCEADFSISAEGKRYGDLIIFDFYYKGTVVFDDEDTFTISDSNVKCRAKLNQD